MRKESVFEKSSALHPLRFLEIPVGILINGFKLRADIRCFCYTFDKKEEWIN